ncbi:hypothetical protein KMP13_08570 [Epibacterium ulvae]|nr:hypothetical protein [Epibacterium ulvae]
MPNSIASVMLLAWPVVSIILFQRLPLERAVLWCLVAGYLILPPVAEFDLPLVPDLNKSTMPSLVVFVLCAFVLKKRISFWPKPLIARALVVLFVLGVIPTVLTNRDTLIFQSVQNAAPTVFFNGAVPGLRLIDLASVIANQLIVLIPFFVGRRFFSSPEGQREIAIALVIAVLFYSIPGLIEIRLSPQVNIWVYGFFQHDFTQTIRQGGYRPLVFLEHPLWYSLFVTYALLSAAILFKFSKDKTRLRYGIALFYLFIFLFLCKSLATQLYAICFIPLLLWFPLRTQLKICVILGVVAIVYPMLRNFEVIPLDAIMAQAQAFSPERAQSLGYRFDNEEMMLGRAAEKPLFGWGGWGRNLVRDIETAEIISIPDGRWIIVFGTFGWFGYIAEMGLLTLPLFYFWVQMRQQNPKEVSPYIGVLIIVLTVTLVDMLLNATLIPFTWLCAGAILGYGERLKNPEMYSEPKRLFEGRLVMSPKEGAKEKRTIM